MAPLAKAMIQKGKIKPNSCILRPISKIQIRIKAIKIEDRRCFKTLVSEVFFVRYLKQIGCSNELNIVT